jgi:DNA cross-link repair 1A protein
MASCKENEAWKEADLTEDRNFRPTRAPGSRRKAPFYKVLQGMPIAVDAFRYGTIPGVTAYFLTCVSQTGYPGTASRFLVMLIPIITPTSLRIGKAGRFIAQV